MHNYQAFHFFKEITDTTIIDPITKNSLLHVAAVCCNDYAVKHLANKDNILLKNRANKTPLHEFFGQDQELIQAVLDNLPDNIKSLSACPSIEDKCVKVFDMLHTEDDDLVRNTDHAGRNSLHFAVRSGRNDFIQKIIQAHYKKNPGWHCRYYHNHYRIPDDNYYSPIDYAARKNRPDIIAVIYDEIIKAVCGPYHTPLCKYTQYENFEAYEQLNILRTFFLEIFNKPKIDNPEKIMTEPIISEILYHPFIFEMLLKKGLNPNAFFDGRQSLLHFVVNKYIVYDIGIIKILLKYNANINRTDMNGDTPLHCFFKKTVNHPRNYELMKLLLENNADIYALNLNNQTPLDCLKDNNMIYRSYDSEGRKEKDAISDQFKEIVAETKPLTYFCSVQ